MFKSQHIPTRLKAKFNQHSNNCYFHFFNAIDKSDDSKDIPLIFILSCPRSGTTLTYQLLINAFELGYVSNRIAPYYGGLGLAEKIFRASQKFQPLSYDSHHGATREPYGPHECGAFWYQFFSRDPHYAPRNSMQAPVQKQLRKHVAAFQRAVGCPLVFKNVMLSGRLQVLQEVFPEAAFVVVRREREATVQSILRARDKVGTAPGKWWSLRPKGFEAVQAKDSQSIAEAQYDLTYRMIDEDLRGRHIDVQYEALCREPRRELERVESQLIHLGIPIRRRAWDRIPEAFHGK